MKEKIVPIILSGGAGSRLWPASRKRQPKQLLPLFGDRSMLLTTLQRAASLPNTTTPMVVSREDQRAGIQRELASAGFADASILLEPIGRNTAPAVAVAALELTGSGENPLLLVMPADHVIADEAVLADAVDAAARLADDGYLIAFGVTPTRPETGYGYIEPGEDLTDRAMAVRTFHEKPDAETAAAYVAGGRHLWNSGMFLFRAGRYLDELERHQPAVVAAARASLAEAKQDGAVTTLGREAMMGAPSISIDHAVMEPTDKAAVVPLDAGWSDVGSWEAMWALGDADEAGNVITGDTEILDVTNSFIRGGSRLIAAIGLDGVAIVDTADATLVTTRDRVQDVKEIVERLSERRRREVETDGTEFQKWGGFATLADTPGLRVLRLCIEPGGKTPLQTHDHRSEYWIVVRGVARITVGETTRLVPRTDSVFVPAGAVHQLENPSTEEMLEVIEVDIRSDVRDDPTQGRSGAFDPAEDRPCG
jgi:mannose-1-phosphate guanylyltransferase/mannose-6-phosphate isomerase